MRIRDIVLALTTMLLWGLNFSVAKLALAAGAAVADGGPRTLLNSPPS
jgi:hypothetical protein